MQFPRHPPRQTVVKRLKFARLQLLSAPGKQGKQRKPMQSRPSAEQKAAAVYLPFATCKDPRSIPHTSREALRMVAWAAHSCFTVKARS